MVTTGPALMGMCVRVGAVSARCAKQRSALPEAYCPALARIVAAANGTLRGEPACDLSGAPFACPLPCPALSEACGATCA